MNVIGLGEHGGFTSFVSSTRGISTHGLVTLPGADRASVDPAKVRDYLLSTVHPIGRSKARFFAALGYSAASWSELHGALIVLAGTGHTQLGPSTPFGQKYLVRGIIQGRLDRAPVVTVWIVLTGEDFPRFITAYPEERSRE